MDDVAFEWWQEFLREQERTTWSHTGGTFPNLSVCHGCAE